MRVRLAAVLLLSLVATAGAADQVVVEDWSKQPVGQPRDPGRLEGPELGQSRSTTS